MFIVGPKVKQKLGMEFLKIKTKNEKSFFSVLGFSRAIKKHFPKWYILSDVQ